MKVKATDNFKIVRLKKGFSQTELAKRVGITSQALGQIERRKIGVSPSTSSEILSHLNVKFDDIFEIVERMEEYGKTN